MMLDERLHSILQYMEKHRAATLKQLAELNGVSLDTVRRDLVRLEDDGKLKRVRGGAVIGSVGAVAQAQSADTEHQDKKQAIAAVLGRYIEDGQAVALCGGTTCAHVAAYLAENRRRLTVLTNNLKALHILASAPSFTIIVPGGIVDADTDELFGQQCEAEIKNYNIDVAVIGAASVSLKNGLTDNRFYQKGVIQSIMSISQKKILAADSTKFDRTASVHICRLEELDVIISDSSLPRKTVLALKKMGLTVEAQI